MDPAAGAPSEPSTFLTRLEARFRPSPGALFLEDLKMMARLPLINGALVVVNTALICILFFTHGETAVGWTVVALGVCYLVAVIAYVVTGRASLYIHGVLWPSLAQNVAAHVMLGGFIWSGATLFWGIIVSVVAALFLGRRPGAVLAGAYLVAAVVFGFLEPSLQARRSQPALAVSVGMAVDVFVISLLILVPIVISLMGQVVTERSRSESLLRNVLPETIANRLKRTPGVIAQAHDECTVMFADIVGFTDHSSRMSPEQLISELNLVFSRFDDLAAELGAEKIKTMGDGYLAVAGAPISRSDHVALMCELALRMQETMPEINRDLGAPLQLRIGLHTGPLVAGVVGVSRFSYDLWGHTVNLASRMEAGSPPGGIRVTDEVARAVEDRYLFASRSTAEVKGVGTVSTCLLVGRRGMDRRPDPVDVLV